MTILLTPKRVRLVFYAQLREKMGREALEIALEFPSDEKSLLAQIAKQFPEAEPLLIRSRIAIGDEYIQNNRVITEAAEIDIISPVSGG